MVVSLALIVGAAAILDAAIVQGREAKEAMLEWLVAFLVPFIVTHHLLLLNEHLHTAMTMMMTMLLLQMIMMRKMTIMMTTMMIMTTIMMMIILMYHLLLLNEHQHMIMVMIMIMKKMIMMIMMHHLLLLDKHLHIIKNIIKIIINNFYSILGCILPLQEVALCQSPTAFSVFCYPCPYRSLLPHNVISLTFWSSNWSYVLYLPLCTFNCPSFVFPSDNVSSPFPFHIGCIRGYVCHSGSLPYDGVRDSVF